METAELIRRCAYVSSKLAALPNTSMILGRRRRCCKWPRKPRRAFGNSKKRVGASSTNARFRSKADSRRQRLTTFPSAGWQLPVRLDRFGVASWVTPCHGLAGEVRGHDPVSVTRSSYCPSHLGDHEVGSIHCGSPETSVSQGKRS